MSPPRRRRLDPPLDAATLRRLAVRASCDPRTIRDVAAGRDVRGLAGERARAALLAAGYPLDAADAENRRRADIDRGAA